MTSNLPLFELKEAIEKQIKHSYLEKYIQKPVIDEDKLYLLSSIISNTPYTELQKKNYIITTMLVQIALDTHDLVAEKELEDETDQNKKSRQLTVLAGDYYSGLYYYLLSQLDDIPMIHLLASAIKELNELKMIVHYKQFDSITEFMEQLQEKESLLIHRVAEHFGDFSVREFTGSWLLVRKLMKEKHMFLSKGYSQVFELLIKSQTRHIQKAQALTVIEQSIQKHAGLVEEAVVQLPSRFSSLKSYVNKVIFNNLNNSSKALEEG